METDQQNHLLQLRQQLDGITARHIADIRAIETALHDKAVEYGWCSQYDEFIQELNAALTVRMNPRIQTFKVTVEATVHLTREIQAISLHDALIVATDDTKSAHFIQSGDARYAVERQISQITGV